MDTKFLCYSLRTTWNFCVLVSNQEMFNAQYYIDLFFVNSSLFSWDISQPYKFAKCMTIVYIYYYI